MNVKVFQSDCDCLVAATRPLTVALAICEGLPNANRPMPVFILNIVGITEFVAHNDGTACDLGAERENPDFVVTEGSKQFGLEVSQVFVGRQDSRGSLLKTANRLQRQYEDIESVPLIVKFVGNLEAENMATLIPALLEQDLISKPVGYRFVHDTTIAHPSRARLRVHVTKG